MDYEATLREFIRSDLKGSIPDIVLERILQPDGMKVFLRAFTHASFSIDNYEILETRGDAYLTSSFMNYLRLAFPTLQSPAIYSEFKSYYTSKPFFNSISIQRGLTKHIRISPDLTSITIDIAEDVFEAYAAAIYETCNEFSPNELGFECGANVLNNYVINIFNSIPISLTSVRANPKVEYTEVMSKLGIKFDTALVSYQGSRKFYYLVKRKDFEQINIPQDRVEAVKDLNKVEKMDRNPNNYFVIGSGIGYNKDEAEKNAARDALNFLRSHGYTHTAVEEIHKQRVYGKDLEHAQLAENLKKVYPEYTFRYTPISGGRTLNRLLYIDENNVEHELLHTITSHEMLKRQVQKELLARAQPLINLPTPPFVYEPRQLKAGEPNLKVSYTRGSQQPPRQYRK